MEPDLNDLPLHPHRHVTNPYLIHNNGLLSPPSTSPDAPGLNPHLLFSSSSTAPASLSPPKKKRGRPRKYGTPEQALAAASSPSSKGRKEAPSALSRQLPERGVAGSWDGKRGHLSKKSTTQFSSLGNAGHGFVPHVIAVAAGDDVAQRVMEFIQQSKREICVLSASGSISTVSLKQPATTGGIITYGGWFEIITLSGSYIQTHHGGRTGGLSVCLSSPDGLLIGGGVGGPLTAAGPVQVIIGSFVFDTKKDHSSAPPDESPSKSMPHISSVDAGHFMVHTETHAPNSWLED
ncbi:hypothetical protein MLD38_020628 [Melastoma candidum]|uniref:Uncharacterized protein n=1 Tax=Melastoma candidum TaxID=119954 RepID=A0ACB9QES4_9MYRT|nr:hypothetical protein MLD38_020628 [Melastoma candidum]